MEFRRRVNQVGDEFSAYLFIVLSTICLCSLFGVEVTFYSFLAFGSGVGLLFLILGYGARWGWIK